MLALVSFAFFIYSAVRQRVEPNWPAPAYIPAIVLIATASWSERGFKWLKAGVGLAARDVALIYAQALAPILPIKPSKDPIARAFGWRELAALADARAIATGDRLDDVAGRRSLSGSGGARVPRSPRIGRRSRRICRGG